MADNTLWSVFDGLLGLSTGDKSNKSVNDNTVEAAIKLISKIGPSIDEMLKKDNWRQKNEEHVSRIFKQFEFLQESHEKEGKLSVSKRLQILIKNMIDNKNSGWSKSKGATEMQTKEQVEEAVYKQAALVEEQNQLSKQKSFNYPDSRDGKYGDKRGGGGRDRKDDNKVYLAKNPSGQGQPNTPDIRGGKNYNSQKSSNLSKSAINPMDLKSPNPKQKGGPGNKKAIVTDEDTKALLQSFTKYVAAKNEFERALKDGEVAEDEKAPEPCFQLVQTLCKSTVTE